MRAVQKMPQLEELVQEKGLSMKDEPSKNLGRIVHQGVVIGRCTDEEGVIFEIAYDEKKKDKSAFMIMKYEINI